MSKILIDRAVVERALEALELVTDLTNHDDEIYDAIDTFCAALAEPQEPETCTWQQDCDSDSCVYGTSCGSYFSITDGTPEDNKMAWCCYCGRKLAQELITEDSDE